MPYTRKQVKLLLSKASPLTEPQKDKMKAELHRNPKLGHARKGSPALLTEARADAEARQLPIQAEDGTLKQYQVPEIKTTK